MNVALASDHAGFEQLRELKTFLQSLEHNCQDFGPLVYKKDDDYPDYIFPAAKAVADGGCDVGIIIGGSGQGEAMAANRVKGVRCAVYYGPAVAKGVVDMDGHVSHNPQEILHLTREHNDANMLSLAARFLSLREMEQAVKVWLGTEFSGDERHRRRNQKLDKKN